MSRLRPQPSLASPEGRRNGQLLGTENGLPAEASRTALQREGINSSSCSLHYFKREKGVWNPEADNSNANNSRERVSSGRELSLFIRLFMHMAT